MNDTNELITEEVKFNVLTEVCSFINSEMPYEEQLQAIVEAANTLIGVKNSSLILLDEQAKLLRFHVATGEKSQELQKMTLDPGEGIAGWVATHGKPLVVPDVTRDARYNPRISNLLQFETQSILCVPIRSRDKIIGSFEAVNRLDGRPFDPKDLPLLTAFASLIGIVLENSHTWRTTEQNKLALEDLVVEKTHEIEVANKNLTIKTQRLALTTKIISRINSNQPMSEILIEVAAQLRRLLPLDYVTAALVQNSRELSLLELFPRQKNVISDQLIIPFDEPVLKYVVKYKRSIFHNRPRWYRCFLEEGRFLETRLGTMLCTPIIASDVVMGTLNMGSIKKYQYAKETVDIVTFIARQVGVGFERENLRNRLEEVNQELNKKTFELRRNIITMGDANLKLFKMQQQLREKDKKMKGLLVQVQKKNQELNATLAELKQAQTQLVQSEKMASLGQLVAGIAHELNTPAGAIKAASEIIPEYLHKVFTHYHTLLEAGLTLEHAQLVSELLEEMIRAARDHERKSTAIIREQSKMLISRLEEQGIPNNRAIAKDIARCSLETRLDLLGELFTQYSPSLIMDFLNNCSRVLISSRDNQLSIETISRIVRALKSYSYLDQSQERMVNLNEDIENTLTILHSQIPANITIIRKFGLLPKISCLGSELNQVWTNLMQNALQALEETGGTILIETEVNSQNVVVKITDNGGGIPEDIQGKIFDPFFTTKLGQTSGLGLSVTQQVVHKHSGSIQLDSVPGKTTFTVSLPKEGGNVKKSLESRPSQKKSTRLS